VFGSQMLEVMIGLLVIYLALSVVCSGIKEVLASLLELRSKTLQGAIRNMLQDGDGGLADKILDHPLIAGTTSPDKVRPSYISSRMFALALLDTVAPPSSAAQPRTIQDLRASIAGLPGTKLRATLLGFVDSAQGNIAIAQTKIEHWFDDTMDRVTGWYKRTAQKVIFVAGLLLCLVLNVDTFHIARELWSDEALRNAVVAQAVNRAHQQSSATELASTQLGSGPISAEFQQVSKDVREAQVLPIGWDHAPDVSAIKDPHNWPQMLLKLLGILVSSFAILMGAPFWFDLLNRIINLRISGDPPASSS